MRDEGEEAEGREIQRSVRKVRENYRNEKEGKWKKQKGVKREGKYKKSMTR